MPSGSIQPKCMVALARGAQYKSGKVFPFSSCLEAQHSIKEQVKTVSLHLILKMRGSTFLSLAAFTAMVNAAPLSSGSAPSITNMKDKIKNFVVLVMENRSFDNLLGGQNMTGMDNPINNGPFCNPLNLTNPSAGKACTAAIDFNSIIDDPDHAGT